MIAARAQRRSTATGFGLSQRALHLRHAGPAQAAWRRASRSFFGTEDTILYSSCFDANGGLFETLLGEEDAIITDELNHASIIDGIRLCKAERLRYQNGDMADLEKRSKRAQGTRLRMIATDGVFSMDGYIAKLDGHLRSRRDATTPWSWWTTPTPRASSARPAAARRSTTACMTRVDVITSTLGKALGGARGGFTTGRKEIVELLRQRSRPYLFSNTLAPGDRWRRSLAVLDLLERRARSCATGWRRTRASSAAA